MNDRWDPMLLTWQHDEIELTITLEPSLRKHWLVCHTSLCVSNVEQQTQSKQQTNETPKGQEYEMRTFHHISSTANKNNNQMMYTIYKAREMR